MKRKFTDLWRWGGTIDRGTYALVGLLGFAIKHNIDRIIATGVFHRTWGIFNYWIPLGRAMRISSLSRADESFLAAMVAISLPFVWLGVTLTFQRLRDAGLPLWLVVLFFAPFINLFFFIFLCLVPGSRRSPDLPVEGHSEAPFLTRLLPESAIGSAAILLAVTIPFGLAFAVLGGSVLQAYGWGLFVALPFSLGLASTLIYGFVRPRSYGSCVLVASLSVIFLGGALLALAVEGVVCLVMAAPLALALGFYGRVDWILDPARTLA